MYMETELTLISESTVEPLFVVENQKTLTF